MTFGTILADLYRRLDFASTPAAEVTTRLKAFVNEAQQELLSEPGMAEWLARNEPMVTFASVANQAVYAMPSGMSRIDAITDRANQRRLGLQSVDWYRSAYPDPTTNTGTPSDYVPFGFMAVSVQPSAATGLWAVSTSASDTTPVVYIETMRTSGVPYSGSVTVTGTTRVQIGTSTDHEQVTKFYVSAAGVGDIKLYTASSGGTLLATIPIGQTFSRYYSFALAPTPAAALTYYVESARPVTDLVNTTDEPLLPMRFHRLLVDGALMREYEKRSDVRMDVAARRVRATMADLRYFLSCPPDFLPVSGTQTAEQSRLGAYFPNGAGIR